MKTLAWCLAVCSTLIVVDLRAQFLKNGSLWYFGHNAGVDFKTDPPTLLERSEVSNFFRRTCAISDEDGNLLFYTDGVKAWDRQHQLMPNGDGLTIGLNHHTMPSIITPHPGDPALYYIFSANGWNGVALSGLHYSVVDITANDGYGAVVQKNIDLLNPSTILLSAVNHATDQSYWIMGHEWATDKFYAYHVTEGGISAPVISALGASYEWFGTDALDPEQMCFSPDGTKLAVSAGGKIQLFDFNSLTGQLTDARTIDVASDAFHGVAFSPNSLLMYGSSWGGAIYQMDVASGVESVIESSIINVGGAWRNILTDLQLAYNGKIYSGRGGGDCCQPLIAIHHPNVKGLGCHFDLNGLRIQNDAVYGLPMSVQSFHRDPTTIQTTPACSGELTRITIASLGYADSLLWEYGDGTSMLMKNPVSNQANHQYPGAGDYTVAVTKYISGIERMLTQSVEVLAYPVAALGPDIRMCTGQSVMLSAGDETNFRWSTNELTREINITASGSYWLETSNAICANRDTVVVTVLPYPNIALPTEVINCDDSDVNLAVPFIDSYSYKWSNGEEGNSIAVQETGSYTVLVSNEMCTSEATVQVRFEGIKYLQVEPASYAVKDVDEIVLLRVDAANANNFVWQLGNNEIATGQEVQYHYPVAGVYDGSVRARNDWNCVADASFVITVPLFEIIPNIFTPNGDGKNEVFEIVFNGDVTHYRLRVFDRYGKMIFESYDPSNFWNGTGYPSAVYYYDVTLGNHNRKGWVQLMRGE